MTGSSSNAPLRCTCEGLLVGADHTVPDDATDLAVAGLPDVGCNRIWCVSCGVFVRHAPGRAIRADANIPLAELHAAPDLVDSPWLEAAPGLRLYFCRCSRWSEAGVQALQDDDPESFRRSPDVPWRCAGHPPITLPHDIDGLLVRSHDELREAAVRACRGVYPARARAADTVRGDWLGRLHARLSPGDAAVVTEAAMSCATDPEPRAQAVSLRFLGQRAEQQVLRRLFERFVEARQAFDRIADEAHGSRTLADIAWGVLEPLLATPGRARELARAEALAGRGARRLYSALAASEPEWFLAHAVAIARANAATAEDLFDSFAQVGDEWLFARERGPLQWRQARERVRAAIAESITLDEALRRTLFPVAAWDHRHVYEARLCIVKPATWGAMLMKAAVVDASERETWNERVRERQGRVGATHSHAPIVWVFEDDRCGVWDAIREVVRGDRRRILLQGSFVATKDIAAVHSFCAGDDVVHRGVRCELATGTSVVVHDERDAEPSKDPEHASEHAELAQQWTFHLGRDLATWLGVPHFDRNGRRTNTRHLEVRARLQPFADDLSSWPADGPWQPASCALGSYDEQGLALRCTPDPGEDRRLAIALRITARAGERERVMKRGRPEQIARYVRHFLTPGRLLMAAHGAY